MNALSNFTSTTFGLLIAFVIPGLAALFSLTFWLPDASSVIETFTTAESNVGLFLLVVLAGILFGLVLTAIRSLIFERVFVDKELKITPEDLGSLDQENTLNAFRAVVDEHYRYHQFWGNMFVAALPLYLGAANGILEDHPLLGSRFVAATAAFLVLESLLAWAAREAYKFYVKRGKEILSSSS